MFPIPSWTRQVRNWRILIRWIADDEFERISKSVAPYHLDSVEQKEDLRENISSIASGLTRVDDLQTIEVVHPWGLPKASLRRILEPLEQLRVGFSATFTVDIPQGIEPHLMKYADTDGWQQVANEVQSIMESKDLNVSIPYPASAWYSIRARAIAANLPCTTHDLLFQTWHALAVGNLKRFKACQQEIDTVLNPKLKFQKGWFTLGLASGHVQLQRLPPSSPNRNSNSPRINGQGTIETAWRTKRHNGSCRSLSFSPDGNYLFSAGSDGLVKSAVTETGRVISKIAVPGYTTDNNDDAAAMPCLVRALSPQILLLATDSSALHVYDLRADCSGAFASLKPQQTYHPHEDYVSSLTAIEPSAQSTSGFSRQWITTGGSTIALTDVRKEIVTQSEDMGEELLSGTVAGGKFVAGGERGVLRSWELTSTGIGDEGNRVWVQKGESLDVLCPIPNGVSLERDKVAVGVGDGTVKLVEVGGNRKPVADLRHDEVEGCVELGFDIGGRMISGGGQTVKVWHETIEDEKDGETALVKPDIVNGFRPSNDDTDEEQEGTSDEEEEAKKPKRKR
ncbi:MAG: hypothetical protein Q9167_001230 [Letrouitia subvulpina]